MFTLLLLIATTAAEVSMPEGCTMPSNQGTNFSSFASLEPVCVRAQCLKTKADQQKEAQPAEAQEASKNKFEVVGFLNFVPWITNQHKAALLTPLTFSLLLFFFRLFIIIRSRKVESY